MATVGTHQQWIMMDTDIAILSNLEPFWKALENKSIALTPHTTKPVEEEFLIPQESSILRFGIFNGGVFAMKKSTMSQQAASWLTQRLKGYGHSCTHREAASLTNQEIFEYVDQFWLNLLLDISSTLSALSKMHPAIWVTGTCTKANLNTKRDAPG